MIMVNSNMDELLFLNNWRYNVVRIQNELKRIFENEGGEVVYPTHFQNTNIKKTHTYVVNRSINERIAELERLTTHPENVSENYMSEFRCIVDELEHLQQINNEPILKTGAHDFVMNDVYYGILFDDNMFFDIHYAVANVSHDGNNRVIQYNYYHKFLDDWKYDCLFKCDCSDADIREAAYLIFNALLKEKPFAVCGQKFYLHSVKD